MNDKIIEARDAGYLGMLANGNLVDRREYPEATPMQKNEAMGIPEPKPLVEMPQELAKPNLAKLQATVRDYIEYLGSGNYSDDGASDYEHCIFEAAVETMYGDQVWNWINSKM